ncbi:MAG: hypothetical protein ACD_15C00097G0004 [uncultured bacterium]|nr:MAG: hypothetical protein ACD_15C00097G0004 [uncultured bacterium]HCU70823.1 hypothetical protein [Candidatus Moranbacteria bacterium]
MKKKFFIALWIIFFVSFTFVPTIILAKGLVPCGGDGESACTLCHLIVGFHNLTTFLTKILISVTLAAIFFSGVMYIISAGDDGMMQSAKEFIKASLIGFAIVLGSWLIINVTLWVISAQMTNIGHLNWYEFHCTDGTENI